MRGLDHEPYVASKSPSIALWPFASGIPGVLQTASGVIRSPIAAQSLSVKADSNWSMTLLASSAVTPATPGAGPFWLGVGVGFGSPDPSMPLAATAPAAMTSTASVIAAGRAHAGTRRVRGGAGVRGGG